MVELAVVTDVPLVAVPVAVAVAVTVVPLVAVAVAVTLVSCAIAGDRQSARTTEAARVIVLLCLDLDWLVDALRGFLEAS